MPASDRCASRHAPSPVVLAGVGAAFVSLPLLALVLRAPWDDIGALARGRRRRARRCGCRIVVSLAATALSLLLGVPLAWILARVEVPGARPCCGRSWCCRSCCRRSSAASGCSRRSDAAAWSAGWLYSTVRAPAHVHDVGRDRRRRPSSRCRSSCSRPKPGLRSIDRRYEQAAATLGARPGYATPARRAADARAAARGRRRAGVGAGARRVRRDDHVRRQPRRAHPDPAARRLRGPARPTRAARSCCR